MTMIARGLDAPPTVSSALLDRLNRELSPSTVGRAGDGSPSVPAALLRHALLEPARHVLGRPGKQLRAELIRLSYQIAGGRGEPPVALLHIIEILHAGSLVIDDVEDGSRERRGAPALHRVVGDALAINTGNWLYFWPLELLGELRLPPLLELEVHRQFAHTMCRAHRGQALDLDVRVSELGQTDTLQVATAIAQLKTGALMGFGARLGALCARASSERVEQLGGFGERLGVGLQMLDDWGSLSSPRMHDKGLEDLRLERVTWPWAFLAERLEPLRFNRLMHALRTDKSAPALAALRETLETSLRAHGVTGQVTQQLRQALTRLGGELGTPCEALEELADHVARLEMTDV